MVVDETVCESVASAMVYVQLRTDTEREVTATVQPSDLSTQSESCLVVMQYTYYTVQYITHACMHSIASNINCIIGTHLLSLRHACTSTDARDYITSILTFSFPNPSPVDTRRCGSVPIVGDTIVEPCEAFYLNLTSSAERSRIVDDDLPNTVIIYDDEGTKQ